MRRGRGRGGLGRGGLGAWVAGGAVLLLALTTVVPFLYMVSTSLMDEVEVLRNPPALLPAQPQWSNYAAALTVLPFGRFFINTAIFAGCVVVGQVATSARLIPSKLHNARWLVLRSLAEK